MPLDPNRITETKSWLIRAARDLRAAEHEFLASPPLLDDIVFHCQQAVEKALKAFLSWHDVPFGKTHDLVGLGRQCTGIDPRLERLLRAAAPLTEYAWKFRYPGDAEEPPREEADDAFTLARRIYDETLDRLPEQTHP